uniref:Ubiquitous surface protein A2 n=1 Tax=Moraxella catarrhalis TaxID=480 RepID=M4QG97_MORCA|nr:ubiquitous surface protein A2 precursor [Moraxella catarrhalis]
MKTMKLLPLKIAVTSAMIIGLGAASTANAQQAQSNTSPLERVRGLIENNAYTKPNSTSTLDWFQKFMLLNQYANVVVMEELNKNVEENKRDLSAVTGKAFKNQIDIQRNNDSIEDLYEANNDNVERLVEHDRAIEILTEAGNHHDTLIRKNKADIKASNGKIESLKTLYETTVRTVGNNEKAIEEHRKLIADNKANIKTLAKAQLESATFFGEQIQENKDDISAVTGKAFKNQIDIQKNNESIDDLYEANNENVERLVEHDRAIEILAEAGNHHDDLIRKNKSDIEDLAANNELQTDEIENLIQASSANTDRIANAELGIAENKKDALIAKAQADKNKNDIQDLAKVQRAGVEVMAELNKNIAGTQTDIANNKITLAQHAKKIDDNQQAIEAKLGGKADLQKLSELKTSVDKNQADIQLHDQKINNLGILHSMVARAVGANKTRIDQNQTDIVANKADADANFETLTKNQNALIEQDEAHDRLIAANKADADAKFTGVQTDIVNNKITLAQHAKKIDDNQQAIEAKLGGKADLQKLSELKTSVDKNQAGIQLHDQKINNLGILHTMVARAVGANKTAIDQNKAAIDKNNESIEDLYEANAENVERLTQVDNNVFVNRLNIQELERKQENDIKDVVGMQNAIAEQADKNKNNIQDLAKAQLAGVEVMTELNNNVEKNKADADASFETLTKNQNTLIEKDKEHDKLITANKTAIDANKTAIDANKASADAKFAATEDAITKNGNAITANAKSITDLGTKVDGFDGRVTALDTKVNGFDGRISALDTKVNAFDGRITALDSKVENGMAAQAALSGLFQPYSVGKFNATAALGGYGSKSAVAIGAGYRVNPNLAFKAGAAINTSGDKKGSYNIGVNYEF